MGKHHEQRQHEGEDSLRLMFLEVGVHNREQCSLSVAGSWLISFLLLAQQETESDLGVD